MPKSNWALAVFILFIAISAYPCSWDNPVWFKNPRSDTPLFRYVVGTDQNARAGYIDRQGTVVIPPVFRNSGNYGEDDFFDGIALVRSGAQAWYIDSKGKRLFRGRFSGRFSEGLATFQEGTQVGFLNKEGAVAIPASFDWASEFSEGLAAVAKDGRSGYINKKGQVIVGLSFALALPFSNGVARVVKESGCVYIGYGPCDRFNPMVLPITRQSFQVATVLEPHCHYSFIDRTGRDVFAAKYREAKDFAEGVAPVGDGVRWGFIDAHGKLAIPLRYSYAEPFAEGLAAVEVGDKWGYTDHNGKVVIPATFAEAFSFSEGVALTIDGNWKYRFIDKSGKQAVPGSFEGANSFVMGLAHVRNGLTYDKTTWSYIDHGGHAVFRYSSKFH